ncbi:bZIP transcription factor [Pyrenophora seminiperda CCB06]|uniref:BZIP transcription factor n=1 Tax=Pyrenophora seminiperda CCB06 TaxID=1302712 RepID=A0A3M7MG65_9PLEO|nr:bZIP transcription factor [Pyrenophora seminiperda CCB06]
MTTDWHLFPTSDSHLLGHDTQLLPGGPTPLSLAECNTLFAVSSGTEVINNMNTSMPMMRDFSHSASSSTSPKDRSSSSPEHSYSSKLSSTKDSPLAPEPSCRVEKRKANTLAARRYRQKRVDQMTTLEAELKQVKAERDDLKVRNARLEGEVETLRALLCAKK